MNIIVQTTGGDASSPNGMRESPNKTLANITETLPLNSSHKKEPVALPISMPYGSSAELRTDCVIMFLTFSGMEQYLHTNTSKYWA